MTVLDKIDIFVAVILLVVVAMSGFVWWVYTSQFHRHIMRVSGLSNLPRNEKACSQEYVGRCWCGAVKTLSGYSWQDIANGHWKYAGWEKAQVVFESLRAEVALKDLRLGSRSTGK